MHLASITGNLLSIRVMKLRKTFEVIESVDHAGHHIALLLVAAATLAELLHTILPAAGEIGEGLAKWLHFLHWFALAVVILYLSMRISLTRNVGKELGQILQERPQTFITLFPSGTKYAYQHLRILEDDVSVVKTADSSEAEKLSAMNEEGFDGSAFEIDGDKLRRRNADWISKNPGMFMLVRKPRTGGSAVREFIGYTSVVPLNQVGVDLYFHGLIKDQDLRASLLCRPGEPSSNYLIFAVVLEPQYRLNPSLGQPFLNFLLKALEYHVEKVVAAHANNHTRVFIWTQSEHTSIVSHLRKRGFEETTPPTKSAEGFDMLRLELVRNSEQHFSVII